jgi:hypothetical protein
VGHHNYELAGPGGPGHHRMVNPKQKGGVGKIFPHHDFGLQALIV